MPEDRNTRVRVIARSVLCDEAISPRWSANADCFAKFARNDNTSEYLLEFGEILFPEFVLAACVCLLMLFFDPAQLHPANFPRDCLQEFAKLESSQLLQGRQVFARGAEDRQGGLASRLKPGLSEMYTLGTLRRIGSGLGTTAASATAACSIKALSNSNGLMR